MPSTELRKLTITLTIVVVIVAHSASGFSLHRSTPAEVNPEIPTDQASQESFQLEVKKDPKSPNDIKQDKTGGTNKATKNKFRFTSELKLLGSAEDTTISERKPDNKTHDTSITEISTQDITTNKTEKSEVATILVSVSENTTQGIKATSGVTSSVNKISPLSESSAKNIDNLHVTTPSKNQEDLKPFEAKTVNTLSENGTYPQTDETIKHSGEMSTTVAPRIHDQIAIDSETTENLLDQKITTWEVTTSEMNSTIESETETNIMTISTTPLINSEANSFTEDTFYESTLNDISTTESITTQKFNYSSELQDDPIPVSYNSASTLIDPASNNTNPITTEQSWKKYTTIERKRTSSSNETSTSTETAKDSINAESIQTTLPIPSLKMLREDLFTNAYQSSTIREPLTGNVASETEMMPILGSIATTQSETLGTVASKRAGFLDLSKITSAEYDKTSSDEHNSDIEAQGIKKANDFESQGQLVEDVINEELMKEEMLVNHEENVNRYQGGKFDKVKPLANNTKTVESTTIQSIIEDNLSVQPINQDRRTTLYTVSPNYKQMKRIEVQPAKPFVRDPDDNSWRNESISSLGIVFKPKNSSSKSYKEVLKNKTETEFNNLQDKYNKGETPELRVRLEKIAEVRKSKKKRIDKFGEVIYTDYEEGSSAEGMITVKPESIPVAINYSEASSSSNPEIDVTTPMTTTENQRYWKSKLETLSKNEMFIDLGLDIRTTAKPKKPYNLAEYYDTTDEYDADYITLPKIDLKKFTIPQKTTFSIPPKTTYSPLTSPPLPPTTRLLPPRFPDRQPTVQYFPPTTKPQKVNSNDYDVDFERRVKQYTLKETPKTVPTSAPVATDRPDTRPTLKPSDFRIHTPDHLNGHLYMTSEPRGRDQNFVINDPSLNRGIYVIKHFRDFLNAAANDDETPDLVTYSRSISPYTEAAARGVTPSESATPAEGKSTEAEYEDDPQFRKDVLDRFVDTFNHNSDRFKVDFPVLFNSSVVHPAHGDRGRVGASSSAFVKRLYGNEPTATRAPDTDSAVSRGCEPNCDNITLELSPAYELHYYVPDQEEQQVADRSAGAAGAAEAAGAAGAASASPLPYTYKL